MRSLLVDVSAAFANTYSGWILWNLFLAFIPLFLSFLLFRRQEFSPLWLWGSGLLIGFIGVVGFWPKLPYVLGSWLRLLQDFVQGDSAAMLQIFWLFALTTLCLAFGIWGLKHKNTSRSWLWGLGLVIFITFLPNAPYVLTDIIHLLRATSSGAVETWVIVLAVIPLHIAAIVLGFEAYVISLLNQNYYLKKHGARHYILPAELLTHLLSAIGIFLGRFVRLNSWDVVTDPTNVLLITLNTLTSKRPLIVIFVTFVILTVLYWIMKQVTLGLKLRIRYARMGIDALD